LASSTGWRETPFGTRGIQHGPERGSFSFALDTLFGIDPLRGVFTKGVAIALTAASVIFTVGFYDYYFGIAHLERGTGVEAYRIVAEPAPQPDAAILYVNAGASTNGAYVRSITFKLANG